MKHKIKLIFWKTFAVLWDYHPNRLPKKYNDHPIAWRWDYGEEVFDYPPHSKILYEWREKGKHWIIYTR